MGDVSTATVLIRQVVYALKDALDPQREQQGLIGSLFHLEQALLKVKCLAVGEELRPQTLAVEQAALQCQDSIAHFLSRINKFQPSLRAGGSGSSNLP